MSNDPNLNHSDPVISDPTDAEALDLGRREALEKLGKLVGYTAPVMLTLLLSSRKAAAGPSDPNPSSPF